MNIDKPQCNLKTCRYCHDHNCFSADYERCEYTLEKRPHGEWIKERLQIDERHFRSFAKCKVCGCEFKPYSFAVKEFDFCPKCGSDMRKEGEKNESDHL